MFYVESVVEQVVLIMVKKEKPPIQVSGVQFIRSVPYVIVRTIKDLMGIRIANANIRGENMFCVHIIELVSISGIVCILLRISKCSIHVY